MNQLESTVYKWVRRDSKKKAQRKFTFDNRKSIRGSMKRVLEKARELKS